MQKWNELQLKFDIEGFEEAEEDARERMISPEEARLISETARERFEGETQKNTDEKLINTDKTNKSGWFKDYLMLIEQRWPWRVACYIAWASSPKVERWPETLENLATETLGLKSARVVHTWRHKYASIDTIVAMMQAAPLWEHRREIIEAMVAVAKEHDYKGFNDRKLALEIMGDYTPKSKVELSEKGNDLSQYSDEELDRMSEELRREKMGKEEIRNENLEIGIEKIGQEEEGEG